MDLHVQEKHKYINTLGTKRKFNTFVLILSQGFLLSIGFSRNLILTKLNFMLDKSFANEIAEEKYTLIFEIKERGEESDLLIKMEDGDSSRFLTQSVLV